MMEDPEQLKLEDISLSSDANKDLEDVDYSDVRLRLLDLSDVDDSMEWFTDEKVAKFCSRERFTSREEAIDYIANFAIPHPWFRAICIKDKAVGTISVSPFTGIDKCRAEIGYSLGSKHWGKGIATKAVKMVAYTIFLEWPHLERLEGLVDVENVGSQRVLEKAGFSREGVLRKYCLLKGKPRDVVVFSLLSTDPQVNYFMYD